jgi:hypothetical protein
MSPLLVAAGATVAKIIHSKTEIVNVAIVLETDVKSTSSNWMADGSCRMPLHSTFQPAASRRQGLRGRR